MNAKEMLLELAAKERRTTLFRKSCARRVAARADYFRESQADAYEQEMIARHYRHDGVKSYESGSYVL